MLNSVHFPRGKMPGNLALMLREKQKAAHLENTGSIQAFGTAIAVACRHTLFK